LKGRNFDRKENLAVMLTCYTCTCFLPKTASCRMEIKNSNALL